MHTHIHVQTRMHMGWKSKKANSPHTKKYRRTHMARVGQNRIYTPYMTICMVISLPKIPYIHRNTYKCMVLANPTYGPHMADTNCRTPNNKRRTSRWSSASCWRCSRLLQKFCSSVDSTLMLSWESMSSSILCVCVCVCVCLCVWEYLCSYAAKPLTNIPRPVKTYD